MKNNSEQYLQAATQTNDPNGRLYKSSLQIAIGATEQREFKKRVSRQSVIKKIKAK